MFRTLVILVIMFFSGGLYAQEQFIIYFDSDKHELSLAQLKSLQTWIQANTTSKVVAINGYTDEDGSIAYNDSLASRRAASVYNIIRNKVPIREDFKSRSFGEKHRLSQNKAENRRVTVYFIKASDLYRENEILGIPTPVAEVKTLKKKIPKYPARMVLQNPDGTTSEIRLDTVFMKQVTLAGPGEKLKIENLNFQLNTFAITKESRSKLYELLLVMEQNPGLKIRIQGHLCCVAVDRQDLSTKRAKAIQGFLVANGIDKGRLSFEGFGSTRPMFPLPEKDESERAANRRVEIEIVENP